MTRLSVFTIWLCAVVWFAFELFGHSNISARLITGLSGFLMALFAMYVSRQLYGTKAAFYTFLMCISYFMVVAFGHFLTLDMLFSSLMFTTIGCLLVAQSQRRDVRHVRKWMLAAWVALALAMLTNGLLAVTLPSTALLVYSLWQRDWGIWSNLHIGKGLILLLLIAAPWMIAFNQGRSEITPFIFILENLQSHEGDFYSTTGSVYYFLPLLFLAVCPWIWTSLRTVFKPAFAWHPVAAGTFHPERFMWVFVVTTLIFFSLVQPELPGYILPILPVIAVMAGERLAAQGFASADRWSMLLTGLLATLVALNIGDMASESYPIAMWKNYAPWILAAGVLYLIAAAFLVFRRNQPMLQVTVAAVLALVSANLVTMGSDALGNNFSSHVATRPNSCITDSCTAVLSFRSSPKADVSRLGHTTTASGGPDPGESH